MKFSEKVGAVHRLVGLYVLLDDHTLAPLDDSETIDWARWMQKANRRVAETMVGPCRISTVFLGLDHNIIARALGLSDRAPLLFETMVFGHERRAAAMFGFDGSYRQARPRREARAVLLTFRESIWMDRYSTWDEAQRGHDATVKRLRGVRRGPYYYRRLKRAFDE